LKNKKDGWLINMKKQNRERAKGEEGKWENSWIKKENVDQRTK